MEAYPEELVVVFLSNLCLTIISAPVCLIAEKSLSAWRVEFDIALAAIVFSVSTNIPLPSRQIYHRFSSSYL